ncbi:AI-2E family transporter [Leucobacter soli]|uniref:Transport protein n=1 Tax=Leucobacter soli TaxID=2812850 RepID=A0A916JXR3_9MICO|nr:AI-2E family transporter [Leucobacter soli]CAG7604503.1 Putative transport protein [Leucobacter soli]
MTEQNPPHVPEHARTPAPELENVEDAAVELPLGMRVAAAWSWRLIVVGVAVAALLWLIVQVRIIVIPVIIAILFTALLHPIVAAFERRGWPRELGVVTALVTFVASVTLLITLIVTQLRRGLGDVTMRSTQAWDDFLHWLETAFGVSAAQVNGYIDQFMHTIDEHQSEIWTGALAITTTAGQVITGSLLALFSLIFLLIDGKRIWYWVLGFLPARAHAPADAAGVAGWASVGQYVRVQIFVAFVDAVGIGVGAAILGVPLAVPIAILVFLGSFIPFLGAITTGALAVFVALVYNGPITAIIMFGIVILVNQVEGHVLQPLVMGNAVSVHPLGVVLAVSAGALLAGIPGALFAVPLAAAASAIVNTLNERRWDPDRDPVAEYLKRQKVHRLAKHRARRAARIEPRGGTA